MFMTEEHNRGTYPEKYKSAVTLGPTNISYIPQACDTEEHKTELTSSRNISPLCEEPRGAQASYVLRGSALCFLRVLRGT
jgi:hypothetical protein